MQNNFNRCCDMTSLDNDLKLDFCNDFGYTLDYRKIKYPEEINVFKTCCNHRKKVIKKINNKK